MCGANDRPRWKDKKVESSRFVAKKKEDLREKYSKNRNKIVFLPIANGVFWR